VAKYVTGHSAPASVMTMAIVTVSVAQPLIGDTRTHTEKRFRMGSGKLAPLY